MQLDIPSLEATLRDLLIAFVGAIAAGTIFFIADLRWKRIRSFLSREQVAFETMFGAEFAKIGIIWAVLDTYRDVRNLSPQALQSIGLPAVGSISTTANARFFKMFPDGHLTWFPGANNILGYCSARAAAYLLEYLGDIPGVTVRIAADEDIASRWEGTFICIGGSSSNIKTDAIKRLPNNLWLSDDLSSQFTFKNGRIVRLEQDGLDKGIVLKIPNPNFRGHSLIVCDGLGEWGTSGSAWFLARRWRHLSSRFGSNSFLVVVSVMPGSDESTTEVLAFGRETRLWRWLHRSSPRALSA